MGVIRLIMHSQMHNDSEFHIIDSLKTHACIIHRRESSSVGTARFVNDRMFSNKTLAYLFILLQCEVTFCYKTNMIAVESCLCLANYIELAYIMK